MLLSDMTKDLLVHLFENRLVRSMSSLLTNFTDVTCSQPNATEKQEHCSFWKLYDYSSQTPIVRKCRRSQRSTTLSESFCHETSGRDKILVCVALLWDFVLKFMKDNQYSRRGVEIDYGWGYGKPKSVKPFIKNPKTTNGVAGIPWSRGISKYSPVCFFWIKTFQLAAYRLYKATSERTRNFDKFWLSASKGARENAGLEVGVSYHHWRIWSYNSSAIQFFCS